MLHSDWSLSSQAGCRKTGCGKTANFSTSQAELAFLDPVGLSFFRSLCLYLLLKELWSCLTTYFIFCTIFFCHFHLFCWNFLLSEYKIVYFFFCEIKTTQTNRNQYEIFMFISEMLYCHTRNLCQVCISKFANPKVT